MTTSRVYRRAISDSLRPYWDPNVEHCGIILNDNTTMEIRNSATEDHEFVMLGEDVMDALILHGTDIEHVAGVFHTHPSNAPHPSIQDIRQWPTGNLRYFIVTRNGVFEWKLNEQTRTVRRVFS